MSQDPSTLTNNFFARYPLRSVQKGEVILLPGTSVTSIFYLISGQAVMYDITEKGSEIVLNAFKPGAFFPMANALNDTPNLYYIEASTESTVRRAPVKDVVAFLNEHPAVVLDLLKRVYRGTDGILMRMSLLMSGDAKARLVFELLNTSHRFGISGSGQDITIPLTETDMAKRSGLTRETVSRTLKPFKEAGIISIHDKRITIHDKHALEQAIQLH